jgi:hypothetical protein
MTAQEAGKEKARGNAKQTQKDKDLEARKRLARQGDPRSYPVWVPDSWVTIRIAPENAIKVQARSVRKSHQANVHVSHPGLNILLEELAEQEFGVASDDSFCWAEFRFLRMKL